MLQRKRACQSLDVAFQNKMFPVQQIKHTIFNLVSFFLKCCLNDVDNKWTPLLFMFVEGGNLHLFIYTPNSVEVFIKGLALFVKWDGSLEPVVLFLVLVKPDEKTNSILIGK